MKRSLLVVAVAIVVVASVCSHTAFGYYHPALGRWLSRDPVRYRGGPNLYGYVASNPVLGRDPSGLWPPGQHESLTRKALDAVFPSLKDPTPNAECEAYMRKTLTKANKDQDIGDAGKDLRRHYLRRPVSEESAEERITNQQVADSAYQSYLASEAKTFADELAKGKDGCDAALKAQGRRAHSLEDFYRHAMRIGEEGFSVWADKVNPANPSPSDREGVVHPTYVGEHPWLWEPPISGAEQDARYSAAAQNTQGEYSANLPTWWKVCGCWCNQKALP
jgi:hypothetical protein